jgi:hypothetical protein
MQRIKERLQPLIAKSFGFELGAGSVDVRESSGEVVETLAVTYQWVARVGGWWRGTVTIACTCLQSKDGTSLRGVLLVPSNFVNMEFRGTMPFRSVIIPGQHDAVAKALEQMNLMAEGVSPVPGNERAPQIDMYIYSAGGHREFLYSRANIEPSWMNLWDALHQTIGQLGSLYEEAEISAFLAEGPNGPPAAGFEKYVK